MCIFPFFPCWSSYLEWLRVLCNFYWAPMAPSCQTTCMGMRNAPKAAPEHPAILGWDRATFTRWNRRRFHNTLFFFFPSLLFSGRLMFPFKRISILISPAEDLSPSPFSLSCRSDKEVQSGFMTAWSNWNAAWEKSAFREEGGMEGGKEKKALSGG